MTKVRCAQQLVESVFAGQSIGCRRGQNEDLRVDLGGGGKLQRHDLHDPGRVTDRSLLADRGYPGVPYFEAVRKQDGSFIVRLARSYDPWIRAAWVEGRRAVVPTRIRLSRFLAQQVGRRMDLDV